MQTFPSIEAAGSALEGGALTIGNFDGLHLGHRRLVDRAVAAARARGTKAAALTFTPHPARILAPDFAPPLIVTPRRKRELFREAGLDAVIEQPFDRDFAALPPGDFATLLLDRLKVKAIVVGYDFTYGKARGGNIDSLRLACEERGAALEIVPPVTVDGLVASSTKIREFVLGGNVEAAAKLLGRPFELEGPVVKGAGRGRTIGVPTANVAAENELVPAIGVYATKVVLPDGSVAMGACNVGLNPTFRPEADEGLSAREISIEVHLLDRAQDLYGQTLRLQFIARLRAERRFASVDALVAQIRADIDDTRRLLAT